MKQCATCGKIGNRDIDLAMKIRKSYIKDSIPPDIIPFAAPPFLALKNQSEVLYRLFHSFHFVFFFTLVVEETLRVRSKPEHGSAVPVMS